MVLVIVLDPSISNRCREETDEIENENDNENEHEYDWGATPPTSITLVPSHTAPCAPSAPRIPAHGGVFVHLRGL